MGRLIEENKADITAYVLSTAVIIAMVVALLYLIRWLSG
jgi:hypothetical protein